jgi:hypothetical protein
MLVANRIIADAFDLGGEPESGAVSPSDVVQLRNMSGYVPVTWIEARAQLHGAKGLMGVIMGVTHLVIARYGCFSQK